MKLVRILAVTLIILACLGQIVPAFAQGVTIVSSFPGNSGPGYKDHPDEAGAVGPKHIVDFDGLNFVVYDKATKKVLMKKSQPEFWADARPANTLKFVTNDPRILYDPLSKRWFACAAGTQIQNGYLAVSTSSDPTRPWNGIQLPITVLL